MANMAEQKDTLVEIIMGHIDTVYKANSGMYKIVKQSLYKLAVYELAPIIVMIETSKVSEKGGD